MSRENLRTVLTESLPGFRKHYLAEETPTEKAASVAEAFIKLISIEPESIDLQLMKPRGLFWGNGDKGFVDLCAVVPFLEEMLGCNHLGDELKEIKAEMFESKLENYLSECGSPMFTDESGRTAKMFKAEGAVLGQADCCRQCGSVLVLIDAKAYRIPESFHRGDYSAVQTRVGYLRGWLEQADRLADRLCSTPVGSNYNLQDSRITHILSVVCTPYPEYIPEQHSSFFLDKVTPRVATPAELRKYLLQCTPEELAAIPCAREIRI